MTDQPSKHAQGTCLRRSAYIVAVIVTAARVLTTLWPIDPITTVVVTAMLGGHVIDRLAEGC